MLHRTRTAAALGLIAGLGVLSPASASAAPEAGASRGCDISGQERKLGATYVTALRVSGVSCSEGKSLVKSFHSCRRSNGGADGKCTRFSGYRCTERRTAIKTQFDAVAECKKGSRVFSLRYTQNT